jgi:hypothetical protein
MTYDDVMAFANKHTHLIGKQFTFKKQPLYRLTIARCERIAQRL